MKATLDTPAPTLAMTKAQAPLQQVHSLLHTLRTKKISMSSLHAVTFLYLHKDRLTSLSDLASNLGITTAAITGIADTLEKQGFAKRCLNMRDRRHTHINLTMRGIAFAEWISETLGPQTSSSAGKRTSGALMAS